MMLLSMSSFDDVRRIVRAVGQQNILIDFVNLQLPPNHIIIKNSQIKWFFLVMYYNCYIKQYKQIFKTHLPGAETYIIRV